MSTKINVRSPYYLNYSEPVKPLPLFTCAYANPQNTNVDESGTITLPTLDFGQIAGYTSTAADFSDGTFAEVSSDTSRTITLTITVPEGFSNANEAIQCDVTATQPLKPVSCAAVVTGSVITPQTLDSGGDSVTLDYSSSFTGTSTDFTDILTVTNTIALDVSHNQADEEITITSKVSPGTYAVYIERIDNSTGCNGKSRVTVTVNAAAVTFDCTTANLLGGAIAADGTLTTPLAVGTITATKETSGGASVTSVAANSSGAAISKTLFYDITVPSGFSNSGNTVECSKTYTQNSTAVTPTFACGDIDFDDQAILVDGNVTAGVAKWHQAPLGTSDPNYFLTITGFNPTSFDQVTSLTRRDVDYTVTVPPGFTNSGNSLTCSERVKQPAADIPIDPCAGKINSFYVGQSVLSSTGLYPGDWRTFNFKNFAHNHWEVKSEVSDYANLAGTTLCNAVGGIYGGPNGTFFFINKIRKASSSTQQEYIAFFGSNNIINSVYLKDWNTNQIRKISG
tara:strand:+ start:5449 stop:6978 length:1530 start_codon:yes stop_codon:yes gene_type:complete